MFVQCYILSAYSYGKEQTSDNLSNTVFSKKKQSEEDPLQGRQSVRRKEISQRKHKWLICNHKKALNPKTTPSNIYMLYADKIEEVEDAKRWQKQQWVGLFNVLLVRGKSGQSMAIIVQQGASLSHHPQLHPTANTAQSPVVRMVTGVSDIQEKERPGSKSL